MKAAGSKLQNISNYFFPLSLYIYILILYQQAHTKKKLILCQSDFQQHG